MRQIFHFHEELGCSIHFYHIDNQLNLFLTYFSFYYIFFQKNNDIRLFYFTNVLVLGHDNDCVAKSNDNLFWLINEAKLIRFSVKTFSNSTEEYFIIMFNFIQVLIRDSDQESFSTFCLYGVFCGSEN